jgi:hypothetical protein
LGRPASSTQGNLTIHDGALDLQVRDDPRAQIRKSVEYLDIARDQRALPVLNMGQRPEAINLQFVNEQIRVERFRTAGEPNGT